LSYIALLSNRTALTLWIGQFASVLGDRVYTMTVMWLVMQDSGSTGLMAVVAVAQLIPIAIFGFIGGATVDRVDTVRLMILSDLGRAALVGLLPLAAAVGLFAPWQLIGVGVGLGVLSAFFVPALQAGLPGIAARNRVPLVTLVGLMDTTDRLARIAGPGLAGLLLMAMSQVNLLIVNALSFIASAITIGMIAYELRASSARALPASGEVGSSVGQLIREGARWVKNEKTVLLGMAVRGWGNFAWGVYTIGLPFLVTKELGADFGTYGLLLAVYGAGTLAGSLIVGNRAIERGLLSVFCLAWMVVGIGFLACGLAPSVSLAVLGTLAMGLAVPFANVSMDAYIGRTTPPAMLGRAYALQRIARDGSNALGLLVGGVLLQALPIRPAFVLFATSVIIAAALALVWSTRITPSVEPLPRQNGD
jgi:MFS family permease